MVMKNYKIEVQSEDESEKVQELAFKLGYKWAKNPTVVKFKNKKQLYLNNGKCRITYTSNKSIFDNNPNELITVNDFLATYGTTNIKIRRFSTDQDNIKFKVGDQVYLKKSSVYFDVGTNPGSENTIGTVVCLSTNKFFDIEVDWLNGLDTIRLEYVHSALGLASSERKISTKNINICIHEWKPVLLLNKTVYDCSLCGAPKEEGLLK